MGVMVSRESLKPDSDPPPHAQLMYGAPPLIPIDVKTERKGHDFTIDLFAHGELFDFEKYVSTMDYFAVAQAAGEEYVPPIKILEFPLNVGGTARFWEGTLSSELTPQPAHATIRAYSDKVAVGDVSVSTIRSDVEIVLGHDHRPATERRLSFWFEEGKGLIKRQFGTTSTREATGP